MNRKVNRKTVGQEGSINTWIVIFLIVIILHLVVILSVFGFKLLKGWIEVPNNKEVPVSKELKPITENYLINPPPEENQSLEKILNFLDKTKNPDKTSDKDSNSLLPPADIDKLISSSDPSSEIPEASGIDNSPAGTPQQPVKTVAPIENSGNYYIVEEGDTLRKIATKTGVSIDEIRKKNHLDKDVVKLGQKLIIPGKSKDKTPVAVANPKDVGKQPDNAVKNSPKSSTPPVGAYKSYRVEKGDTLNKIAVLFHTSPEKLSKINDISDPRKLKVGMEIKVPKE